MKLSGEKARLFSVLYSVDVPLPLRPRFWLEARRMQTLVRSNRRRSYLYASMVL